MSAFSRKTAPVRRFSIDRRVRAECRRPSELARGRRVYRAEALEERCLLSAVTWTGAQNNGLWSDPLNWTGGTGVPTAADDVTIGSGFTTISASPGSVHSLTSASPISLPYGNLDVTTTMNLSATLTVGGGELKNATVSGSGAHIAGSGYLSGLTMDGDVEISGVWDVTNGLTVNGTLTADSSSYLAFYGSQVLGGTGKLVGAAPKGTTVAIQNWSGLNGATLTIGSGMTVENAFIDSYDPHGTERLINEGTINADIPGDTFKFANILQNFVNYGTLEATGGGTLAVYNLNGAIGAAQVSGANSSLILSGANWKPNLGLNAPAGTTLTLAGSWTNPAGSTISADNATLNLNGNFFYNYGIINAVNSTVNLGGSFSATDLTGFHRTGGVVNLTGAFANYGNTLALNATTGSWNLAGGTIFGGTIAPASGGAALLITASSTFDGVTLTTPLTTDNNSNSIVVKDGLTLNATLTIGSGQTGSGGVTFLGTQTLGGNGQVLFMDGLGARNTIDLGRIDGTTPMTLTIGPGIVVHGGTLLGRVNNPTIGAAIYGDGIAGHETIINQGIIGCDLPGGAIGIYGSTIINNGMLQATGGGRLTANGLSGNANAIQVAGVNSTLNLSGTNWVNNQPVTAPAGATLTFSGTWTNTGGVNVMGGNFNIGGTIPFAALGPITRNGGTVTLVGTLDDTGATLALSATTGSWNLAGTIKNGVITAGGGATLVMTSSATFDGVTLNTDLSGGTYLLTVMNGLTLNAVMKNVNVLFTGTQQLTGTGAIVFGGTSQAGAIILGRPSGSNSAVSFTVGPGITIHGGNATISGIDNFTKMTLINQGTISADQPGQSITLGTNPFNAVSVTNEGTFPAAGGGSLFVNYLAGNDNTVQLSGAGSIVNLNGTNWVNNQPITVPAGAGLGFQGTFTNTGGVNLIGGTYYLGGFPPFSSQVVATTFQTASLGPITNTVGTVAITGLLDNTGATLVPNGKWNLDGGTIKNGAVSAGPGAAPFFILGGMLDGVTLNTDVSITGAGVNVVNGLTLNATMTVTGGATQSGVVQFSGTQTLGGSGQVILVGTQTSAILQIGTVLTIAPGMTVHSRGTNAVIGESYWPAALLNQGTIGTDVADNILTFSALISVTNTGALETAAGGTLKLQKLTNLAGGVLSGGTWEALSGGKMTLPSSVTSLAANILLDGPGSLITDSGGINNALAGLYSVAAGGNLSLQNGQNLAVTPTGGTLTNHGTLALGAGSQLSVKGAFTQAADGTLAVQIPDPVVASFGQLTATGAATLAGTLQATLGAGYNPAAGQSFDVVTGSSEAGTFSSFSGGNTPGGRPLALGYTAATATITVNPAAPTLLATQIDDGNKQRSLVRSLTFTFSTPVTLSTGAITLALSNTGGSGANNGSAPTDASAALGTPTTSDGGLTWVVPIKATSTYTTFGSLNDGIYTATVHAGLVTDAFSQHLSGGDQAKTFHRLFGDLNGDKRVNATDFQLFAAAFGALSTSPNYVVYLDYQHDGRIISNDYQQFAGRFGKAFIYAA